MQERVDLSKYDAKAQPPRGVGERVDPPSREVDFAVRASRDPVRGKDPKRKYVVAHGRAAVDLYERRGYTAEIQSSSSVYVGAQRREALNGTEVTHLGGVVMSIDQEQYEQIKQYGDPDLGDAGQKFYDPIEKRIINGGGVDPMRGKHGPGKGMRVDIDTDAKSEG